MPYLLLFVSLFSALAFGFQPADIVDATGPNSALLKGRLIQGPMPKFPSDPTESRIGVVVLRVLIDERGVPTQVGVAKSFRDDIDQAAVAAVKAWRYRPLMKDGKPAKVLTDITFSMGPTGSTALEAIEGSEYNQALIAIKEGHLNENVVNLVKGLAARKFPPGLYLYGIMLKDGKGVAADPQEGVRLIREASDLKYGPAEHDVALAMLRGDQLPKDPARGFALMQKASRDGSLPAQAYLGNAHETGEGVPKDFEKSRQYFRLCAAAGDPVCQFRLGNSLLDHSNHPDRDYIEAIAWLQLASDHGASGATELLGREEERLTPAQVVAVGRLKTQLVHTP